MLLKRANLNTNPDVKPSLFLPKNVIERRLYLNDKYIDTWKILLHARKKELLKTSQLPLV